MRHTTTTAAVRVGPLLFVMSFVLFGCSRASGPEKGGGTTKAIGGQADAALLKAIDDGDFDAVRVALRRGANPNDIADGYRVLGHAIMRDEPSIVRELIRAGADVNATTADVAKVPMLYLAIDANNRRIVEALLSSGAKIEKKGGEPHLSVLGEAAVSDAGRVCWPLVHAGADVNSWDLWPAQMYGAAGSPHTRNRGRTPLMIAASMGHASAVVGLLSVGADVTLKNERGDTALDLTREAPNPLDAIRRYLTNPDLVRGSVR